MIAPRLIVNRPERYRPASIRKPELSRKSSPKPEPKTFYPPSPRVFQPAPRPAPESPPALAILPKPSVELPRETVAPVSLPQSSFPPPMKTGTFAETQTARPIAIPQIKQVAGFEPVVASVSAYGAGPANRPRTSAGFGDASVAAPATPVRQTVTLANILPVEILDKPRPAYTEEARRLSVEGEVLIEVLFEASGRTSIRRLVRGLGHGLDENALSAARQIRFRPAREAGAAVDSLAVVHILFQLAY
jgi:TonB family protein